MKKFILTLFASLLVLSAQAQQKYFPGVDYIVLDNPIPLTKSDRKEVAEVFWYGCPHCYSLSPDIEKWVKNDKPSDTDFYYLPATLGSWAFAAKAHYTAQKLGLDMDAFKKAYFKAFHIDKNRGALASDKKFFEFLEKEFNTSTADAKTAWDSFEVKKNLETTNAKITASGINSVPAFIVNGEYVVDVSIAGTKERLFDIIEFLLTVSGPDSAE